MHVVFSNPFEYGARKLLAAKIIQLFKGFQLTLLPWQLAMCSEPAQVRNTPRRVVAPPCRRRSSHGQSEPSWIHTAQLGGQEEEDPALAAFACFRVGITRSRVVLFVCIRIQGFNKACGALPKGTSILGVFVERNLSNKWKRKWPAR